MKIRRLFASAVLVSLPCAAIAASTSTVQVEVTSNIVTATGVTPRGDVIFYGRSIGRRNGTPLLERFTTMLRDEDGDGVVSWMPPKIFLVSAWVAIDLESGNHGAGAALPFEIVEFSIAKGAWRSGNQFAVFSRDRLDLVLVRPGVGAWTLAAFQGGPTDMDGRNDAYLTVALSQFERLYGNTPTAPPIAKAGDVLLVFDPLNIDLFLQSADEGAVVVPTLDRTFIIALGLALATFASVRLART